VSTSICLVISVVWIVAAIINGSRHNGWQTVVFDIVLALIFLAVGVVRAVRAGEGGSRGKGKKKK
jgi:hypothetical protein